MTLVEQDLGKSVVGFQRGRDTYWDRTFSATSADRPSRSIVDVIAVRTTSKIKSYSQEKGHALDRLGCLKHQALTQSGWCRPAKVVDIIQRVHASQSESSKTDEYKGARLEQAGVPETSSTHQARLVSPSEGQGRHPVCQYKQLKSSRAVKKRGRPWTGRAA